jgi:hypothetical protein
VCEWIYFSLRHRANRSLATKAATAAAATATAVSLTTFNHSCACGKPQSPAIACQCSLKNTDTVAGDEVLMVFGSLSPAIRSTIGTAHSVPLRRLVDFERVTLSAGATTTFKFSISPSKLVITSADGTKKLYPGLHNVIFSRGNGWEQTVAISL